MRSPAEAAPGFVIADELPDAGGTLMLSEAESHYLTRVCRARPGDPVRATDGRGGLATVRLTAGGRRVAARVESCERETQARAAWALVGPPEGERADWMVEKLAELGVTVFIPLDCERGRWQRVARHATRWRRLATAALRQSRRRYLLDVRSPLPIQEVERAIPPHADGWLADPSGPPLRGVAPAAAGISLGLIGPASGLTGEETEALLTAGFRPICLSDGRLRTETAALSWAAWWTGSACAEGGKR